MLPVTRGALLFLNAGSGAVANASRSQKPARLDPLQPVAVLAQSSGGAIKGTITDPSGAVIQGAVVNIVKPAPGRPGDSRATAPNFTMRPTFR